MWLAEWLRRAARRPPGRKCLLPPPPPDEPGGDEEDEDEVATIFEGDITISLPALRRWPRARLFGVTWAVRLTDGD